MVLVLVLLAPTPLAAQTDQPALFVTGAFFGGIERLNHFESKSPTRSNDDVSGSTTGGTVSVGAFVARRWSVRLDFEFPTLLETTDEPTAIVPPPFPVTRIRVQIRYRTRSASVLLGYHTERRRRVRVGYLAGVAFVEERRHRISETIFPFPPPIPVLPSETTLFSYRAAGVVGLDGDVALTSHLSLVPQARARWFLGSVSARLGAGIRWNF